MDYIVGSFGGRCLRTLALAWAFAGSPAYAQGYDQPRGAVPLPVNTLTCATSQVLQPMAAYDITLTGPCVLSLGSALTSGLQTITVVLRQGNSGGYLPALPSGVKWQGGGTPTPNSTAGKIDVFTFRTTDGGTTWFGGN